MGMKLKSLVRRISLALFSHYPFINVFTLLLLLAERATREKFPPFGATAIYANVGCLFACAVGMSFTGVRKFSAIIHSVHLLIIAAAVFFTDALHYRKAVKMRMAIRMVGVSGYFLLYAYFTSPKPRFKAIRRSGEILVGIYVLVATYAVLQVAEDREGFVKMIPFPEFMLFVYATFLGVVGLCLLPGLFVYDVIVVLMVLLTLITASVDCRVSYWTKRRGIDYWNQIRLISDNFAIVCGCLVYLSCSRQKLPKVEDETSEKND